MPEQVSVGWLPISAATRQRTAPEFVLFTADGRRVARSDTRDKASLVLFFLDPDHRREGVAAVQQAGREIKGWAEVEARALFIVPPGFASPASGDVPVVIDADGSVRSRYAALVGAADSGCFVIVLDRYGAPFAAYAHDPATDAEFAQRLHAELTALFYDCPE